MTITVTNPGDSSAAVCPSASDCTLNQAIRTIDTSTDPSNVIDFAGPMTVQPTSGAWTFITRPVAIRGCDKCTIDGSVVAAAGYFDSMGLLFGAGSAGSSVTNLDIVNFPAEAIHIQDADNIRITGTTLGLQRDGTPAPNLVGILVGRSTGDIIGGPSPADRNVISGNGSTAISYGEGSSITVQGNYIGVGVDGRSAAGNGEGIRLLGSGAVIGGPAPADGNVISDNTGPGVFLPGNASHATIESNTITNNTAGVVVGFDRSTTTTFGNSIRRNRIALNPVEIDLGNDGVTPNHAINPLAGPNHWQNYPVLRSVLTDGTTILLRGFLKSVPSASFAVDFYAQPRCDASGHGPAITYIGSATVLTDTAGQGVIDTRLTPGTATPSGSMITATATNSFWRDTSELSACTPAEAAPRLPFPAIHPFPPFMHTDRPGFDGTTSPAVPVTRVDVAVLAAVGGAHVAKVKTLECRVLTHSGHLARRPAHGGLCSPSIFIRAQGTRNWKVRFPLPLPRGRYFLFVRATDAFHRQAITRRSFTVH